MSSRNRFFVYILLSQKDSGFYIGFTTNLLKRLQRHNSKQVLSTKDRTPFKLLHYEYFINRKDALAREKYLKSGYGRLQWQTFLKNTLTEK